MQQPKHYRGKGIRVTCLALAMTMAGFSAAHASLTINRAASTETDRASDAAPPPIFNDQDYEIVADRQYSAVVSHGEPGSFEPAPSYGDRMSLSEALDLLLPDGWQALRNRELGEAEVEWEVNSGNWMDVIRNIGERVGLQFHLDHERERVYIREGRKILHEPEYAGRSEPAGDGRNRDRHADSSGDKDVRSAAGYKRRSAEQPPRTINYDVTSGEKAQEVFEGLGELARFDSTHWLTGDERINDTENYSGHVMEVIKDLADATGVRVCLYSEDQVMAVVNKSAGCPQ